MSPICAVEANASNCSYNPNSFGEYKQLFHMCVVFCAMTTPIDICFIIVLVSLVVVPIAYLIFVCALLCLGHRWVCSLVHSFYEYSRYFRQLHHYPFDAIGLVYFGSLASEFLEVLPGIE